MIDFSKFSRSPSPAPELPSTPQTGPTTPVEAPVISQPAATEGATGLAALTGGGSVTAAPKPNKLPWEQVGDFLFQKDSPLNVGIGPVNLGNVIGAVGNAGAAVGEAGGAVVKAGATAVSHVPLSWLDPTMSNKSADAVFQEIGDFMQANDPASYEAWKATRAAADNDILGGGNMKADFNREAQLAYDAGSKEGLIGANPYLNMSGSVGSLGGLLANFLNGAWNLPASNAQGALGNAGFFDPGGRGGNAPTIQEAIANQSADFLSKKTRGDDVEKYVIKQFQSGAFTEAQANDYLKQNIGAGRSRVMDAVERLNEGAKVGELFQFGISETEAFAAKMVQSGRWTEQHGNDYIVREGQSITRNPVGQIGGGLITDPLTWAMPLAGSVAKAAKVGTEIIGAAAKAKAAGEAAVEAQGVYEKLGVVLSKVTQHPIMGPVARATHGIVDPFTLIPQRSVTKGLVNLYKGAAVHSYGAAYGHSAVDFVRRMARAAGKTEEIDSAMASSALDKGETLMGNDLVKSMAKEGRINDLRHLEVAPTVRAAAESTTPAVIVNLTDHIARVAKNTFTPEELRNLAGRIAHSFGGTVEDRAEEVATMSQENRSILHDVTHKHQEKELVEAMSQVDKAAYQGDTPLERVVLGSASNLDDVSAEALHKALTSEDALGRTLADQTASWNEAAHQYPEIAEIGIAPGGKPQLDKLHRALKSQIDNGEFHRRFTEQELSDPTLAPLVEMLDRSTVDGKRIWNLAFRPAADVSWNLKEDALTGAWKPGRDVSLIHNVDAVGQIPRTDTVRNALGMVVGSTKAETLTRPIESAVAFANTMRDVVSGRRLVQNIQQRFERTMFEEIGVPKPVVKDIFDKATEIAGLNHTTVKGLPINDNLWEAINKVIPAGLKTSAGEALNVHVVMDHLLRAAEGDLRVIGATSKMSQKLRNMMREKGILGIKDGGNRMGELTVTQYNSFRYAQPTFLIQRVTDGMYFLAMRGIMPVGKGRLTGALADVEDLHTSLGGSNTKLADLAHIDEVMGETQIARDAAMSQTEYNVRSNFTRGLTSRIEKLVGRDKTQTFHDTQDAASRIITNNLIKDMHSRIGEAIQDHLDDVEAMIAGQPEALQAEMRAEITGPFMQSMDEIRNHYQQIHGRYLTSNEAGLMYLQDIKSSMGRIKTAKRGADGRPSIDVEALMHEASMHSPDSIGAIRTIYPETLAHHLGYADAKALRRDIQGTYTKTGEHVVGGKSIEWLRETLKTELNASDGYINRAAQYFGDTDWTGYWNRLAQPVEKGGLDISPHAAESAKQLIRDMAAAREMDPWEYLSQVMSTNIGKEELDSHIGRLAGMLQAGGGADPIAEWAKSFKATLDVSAQHTLLDNYSKNLPGEIDAAMRSGNANLSRDLQAQLSALRGGTAESGGAIKEGVTGVPAGFTTNPHVAASGTTSTLPRDGLFHVTTAKDAVESGGFKTGSEVEGFGSKGDTVNAGRVSILTNRARATTYLDRIQLAGKAARGEADRTEVIDYFTPLYDKAFGGNTKERMFAVAGDVAFENASTPQEIYQLVRNLDGGLIGGNLSDAERAVKLVAPFESAKGWKPDQIALLDLASKERAVVNQGLDAGELTLKPEDLAVVGSPREAARDTSEFADTFTQAVKDRMASGVPHENPEVEGYFQHFSAWMQKANIHGALTENSRKLLNDLVDKVPTVNATPFNRTQAMILRNMDEKLATLKDDAFMLAEMSNKRTVAMRTINHPLFGLYPAAYMWGKVLPQTIKYMARNPYGLTYDINQVQRSIATMREYDPTLNAQFGKVDRSALMFALGYLTPSLPWEDMRVGASPLVRDITEGKLDPSKIASDEFHTMSPERWWSVPYGAVKEIVGGAQKLAAPPAATDLTPAQTGGLQSLAGGGASGPTPTAGYDLTGPTPATGIKPILEDQWNALNEILRP